MRKFIFLSFCSFWLVEAKAQISIYDCSLYENAPITQSQIEQAGYEFNRPCVELDNTFNFSGSSNKAITSPTSIHIKPGFYAGNYDADGGMFLKIQPKADFDVAVMNYTALGAVLRYDKLELGITLPPPYKDKLDLFIANELDPNLNANPTDMINPFLEWDLDIEATFTHVASGTVKKLDAFFTRDMARNETTKFWDALPSDYHMRVRFAPPSNGVWNCVVNIKVNGEIVSTSDLFNFKVIESDKHGYITVHPNKKNFALDGEVIFPVGQNIPHTTMTQYDEEHNLVFTDFTNRTEFCNDIEGWKDYIGLIDQFGALGGRFTRIFAAPHAGLVEWEEKGNYFRRMHHAFEMDNVIDKLAEHDMFTVFDLLLHNYFMQYADYNAWPWDWDRKIICQNNGACYPNAIIGTEGNYYYYPTSEIEPWQLDYPVHPYNSNPGVKMPHEMFLDEFDLKYHEQRIRYYISRYGYSTQIYIWEQAEETFHLSQDWSNPNQGGGNEPYFNPNSSIHGDVLDAVDNYVRRMNAFVRDHLEHSHQLLGVYAMSQQYGKDETINNHDLSIFDPNADCIAISQYTQNPNGLLEDDSHQDPDDNYLYIENENSLLARVSIFGNNYREDAEVNPAPTTWKRPVYITESGVAYDNAFPNQIPCLAGADEKLDNTRFGFSGIAGFNKWHYNEGNNYYVWENIIRSEQHMNGQEVRNVIGSNYKQGRQQEELNFGSLGNNGASGNVLEMQYYLSEDKNNAVGYVYNRTVNYKTAGNSTCRTDFPKANFNNIVNIDWEDDGSLKHLKINELPSSEDYDIDFYASPNMQYLFTSHVSSGSNDKIIVEFPELTSDSPVVWFVCKKLGGRNENNLTTVQENTRKFNFEIYPNPTTGRVNVPKNLGAFEVYTSLGMKVIVPQIENTVDEIQLDFKGFAKGIYYIQSPQVQQTFKICVI